MHETRTSLLALLALLLLCVGCSDAALMSPGAEAGPRYSGEDPFSADDDDDATGDDDDDDEPGAPPQIVSLSPEAGALDHHYRRRSRSPSTATPAPAT